MSISVKEKYDFLNKHVKFLSDDEIKEMLKYYDKNKTFKLEMNTEKKVQEEFNREQVLLFESIYKKWYEHMQEKYKKLSNKSSKTEDEKLYFNQLYNFLKNEKYKPSNYCNGERIDLVIEETDSTDSVDLINKDNPCFENGLGLHIKTERIVDSPKREKTEARFYLCPNPKHANNIVKLLLEEGMKSNPPVPVYLKFRTYITSDMIIIYVDYKNAEKILELINNIETKYPEYFDGSKQLPGYGKIGKYISFGENPNEANTSYTFVRESMLDAAILRKNSKIKRVTINSFENDCKGNCSSYNIELIKNLKKSNIFNIDKGSLSKELYKKCNHDISPIQLFYDLFLREDYKKTSEITNINNQNDYNRFLIESFKIYNGEGPDINSLKDKNVKINWINEIASKILMNNKETETFKQIENVLLELYVHDKQLNSQINNMLRTNKIRYATQVIKLFSLQYYLTLINETQGFVDRAVNIKYNVDKFTFSLFGETVQINNIDSMLYKNLKNAKAPTLEDELKNINYDNYNLNPDLRYLPLNNSTIEELRKAGYDVEKLLKIKTRE